MSEVWEGKGGMVRRTWQKEEGKGRQMLKVRQKL